jgi:hypothetical protein
MRGILPSFLKFDSANDLVRVGKDYDGGYLVSKVDIDKSEVLVGLGINYDWSFEENFLKHKKVPLFAYDASTNKKEILKNIINSLIRLKKTKLLYWVNVYFSYKQFFSEDRKHIKKFVGLNVNGKHSTMNDVLSEVESNNIFLKIDIEGSEYDILNTLISNRDRICGLVIEFHDCDIHLAKIKNFVEEFGLRLIHIHANNFEPTKTDDDLPTALELTFSKNSKVRKLDSLPHIFDMPNDRFAEEINLEFEK